MTRWGIVATVTALLALAAPVRAQPSKLASSGPLKAYKGPDGEIVAIVPVNDDKQVLVYFRSVDDDLDGRALLFELEDRGDQNKDIYENYKRGSKTSRLVVLTQRDGDWEFFHPHKPGTRFPIIYSHSASARLKVDDVINAYKP